MKKPSQKKNTPKDPNSANLDNWLKEIDGLEGDLSKLKNKFDNKKKETEAKFDKIIKSPLKKTPDQKSVEDEDEEIQDKNQDKNPDSLETDDE